MQPLHVCPAIRPTHVFLSGLFNMNIEPFNVGGFSRVGRPRTENYIPEVPTNYVLRWASQKGQYMRSSCAVTRTHIRDDHITLPMRTHTTIVALAFTSGAVFAMKIEDIRSGTYQPSPRNYLLELSASPITRAPPRHCWG